MRYSNQTKGFTLIEMSIVLVIIGLIVGGVLVGRDLITSAQVRAQVTQIEKFNTATNTFRGKYGALPGDMDAGTASSLGFAARSPHEAQGDGNGVIEGWNGVVNSGCAFCSAAGESVMYWSDLTYANGMNVNLIEGTFSVASATVYPSSDFTGTTIGQYIPQAKIGQGNYIYIWSGGATSNGGWAGNSTNYYAISAVTKIKTSTSGLIESTPGLTVRQAYNIDKKMDDGFPQTGNVTAQYFNNLLAANTVLWAAGNNTQGTSDTSATSPSSTTCYDNGGNAGIQNYSVGYQSGANVNCALTFKFQ